ncbi:FAD-dependent oxidoreductase [Clostridium sp.]|uniref:FAD-dependent oxidoreductase n=1 Tax=Clostridium sp. TaxID=1506 RepID=UPI0028519B5A|nr:FAD-dependent oxidoreductase [Clostridium sp.]MDR3594995.1 FAD-dependent oxidoreductase [Clostridium sp.]
MSEIITPNSDKYEQARQEWNRSIQKYPCAIVYCESYKDVSTAIRFACKNNIPLRIRSGGHNYEGYSIANKALIIDVSKLNKIQINYDENTVTIQGGVNNSQLYNFISSKGYPFPGGACPTVGVSGYALGGGWGYSCRYLGLGCDSLVEIKLINYKGNLITADEYVNSDLFWACRGAGGGNFGVIVSMTFKLPPKVGKVTLFEIHCSNESKAIQIEFLNTWQKWIITADPRINMNGGLYNTKSDGKYIHCRGLFYGTPDELQSILKPFKSIKGVDISAEYLSFLAAINKIGSSYPPFEYFKSTGRFVYKCYTLNEIEDIVDIVNQERPAGSILTSANIYGLGGKVSEVNKFDTAFYYRKARYILSIQSVWESNEYKPENVEWVNKNFNYIYSITNGSYINFPFFPLPSYEHDYYGQNVNALQCIKCKYDPYNVFMFQQGIKY